MAQELLHQMCIRDRLEGLEVLPTKTVTYKGISLKEFDLDGALARHPQLLLVDELAPVSYTHLGLL